MRLLICLVVVVLMHFSLAVKAQDVTFSGASSLALGGIKSVERNHLSVLTNPAGIASIQSPGIAFTYACPYNLQQLSDRAVSAVLPSQWGHFSLLFAQSGYSLSRFNRYGLAYSRTFGRIVAASFQFNGVSHFIQESGTSHGFFSTAGLQFFPSKAVIIGFFIQNVEQSQISYPEQSDLLPVIYAVGLEWKPQHVLSMFLEMEKDQEFNPLYKFGMELRPIDLLKIRGGLTNNPIKMSFGIGLTWKFIEMDVGLSHHQQLGITSGASFSFSLQKELLKPKK